MSTTSVSVTLKRPLDDSQLSSDQNKKTKSECEKCTKICDYILETNPFTASSDAVKSVNPICLVHKLGPNAKVKKTISECNHLWRKDRICVNDQFACSVNCDNCDVMADWDHVIKCEKCDSIPPAIIWSIYTNGHPEYDESVSKQELNVTCGDCGSPAPEVIHC